MTRKHCQKFLYLCLLLTIALIAVPDTAFGATQIASKIEVEFTAQLNKDTYVFGEPIAVTVSVSNISQDTFKKARWAGWFSYMNYYGPHNFTVEVRDASGKKIRYGYLVSEGRLSDGPSELPPSGTASTAFDMVYGDVVELADGFYSLEPERNLRQIRTE